MLKACGCAGIVVSFASLSFEAHAHKDLIQIWGNEFKL